MANEEGRTGRSAAWGIAAGVFCACAIATWQVAIAPRSSFPIWPTYIFSGTAAVALYMCFATIWNWWPTARAVRGPSTDAIPPSVAAHDPDSPNAASGLSGSALPNRAATGTSASLPAPPVTIQATGSVLAEAVVGEAMNTTEAGPTVLPPTAEAPEPVPLVTDRWLYASWDERAAAAMNLLEFHMPGANHNQHSTEFLAWVRFLAVMKCSPMGPDIEGKQLWSWLEQFLAQPPVNGIVSALTAPVDGLQWTRWATSFASTVDAMLTRGAEDQAVASARLDLPDDRHHRLESDSALLMLNFEPARNGGKPLPAFKPDTWDDLIQQALEIPGSLAEFLSRDLSLTIPDGSSAVLAVRLDAATDLAELIDVTGLEPLPGARRRRQAIGYFLSSKDGSQAPDAAKRMVTDVLRYGFSIER